MNLKKQSNAQLELTAKAARRAIALQDAQTDLLAFVRLMMPDPEDVDDARRSLYSTQPHHRLIAEALEKVARRELMRLAISIPPQFGKSTLATLNFIAWYMGRFPQRHIIFATYSTTFAEEWGASVRTLVTSAPFKAIFPKFSLRTGQKGKGLMVTGHGGKVAFIGRQAGGSGKPADLIVLDDLLKNEQEAESPTIRKELHGFFDKVVTARVRNNTAIIQIATRWHEDDEIGRQCDVDHPDRLKDEHGQVLDYDPSRRWVFLNLPAVLKPGRVADALGIKPEPQTDPLVVKAFGTDPLASLWPGEFSLRLLAEKAVANPVAFNALYMGKPSPDDGYYFKAEWLLEYDPHELPAMLQKYGASDHAVTEDQQNDSNVLGCVGIDSQQHIWVLPDLVWDRFETDRTVEELLMQFATHRPLLWWMESELISKSFGPFLHKRMLETNTITTIDPVTPAKDKRVRARAIQGRMSMKIVHFPRFAPWWRDARSQILKFPFATHDDFVDWLAHIGLGLMKQVGATKPQESDKVVRVGSAAWMRAQSARRDRETKGREAISGW